MTPKGKKKRYLLAYDANYVKDIASCSSIPYGILYFFVWYIIFAIKFDFNSNHNVIGSI